MSRIVIIGSENYGDDQLVVGWDPGTLKYFVVVDNGGDEPSYWKPLLNSIEDVRICFAELGEPFHEALEKRLIQDRLASSEEVIGFDSSDKTFW